MTVDEVKKASTAGRRRRRRSRREDSPPEESAQPETALQETARKDRPTPSRRESVSRGNIITRTLRPVVEYLSDTRSELQKVTWPTREESLRLSGIVIAVTVISSLALGVMDFLYGELFRLGFDNNVIFLLFGVVLVVIVGVVVLLLRRRGSY